MSGEHSPNGTVLFFHEWRTLKSFSMCAEFSAIFMDFQRLAIIENLFMNLYLSHGFKALILKKMMGFYLQVSGKGFQT
ncbi:hypothetical protein [Aeromonas dhakensis]|uniref:hypothetical protein n=1 Tax=Aeromonas dhakensis TaxID=196024 RepID=UPI001A5CF993|nr:hypothetical protein [Aeromonas dhakensis]MBL0634610.1 hypothetical protein [Aeromonas dhakensis]